LHETIRNNFEYCEVVIPFFNRGTIKKIDNISPTSVSLCIGPDNKSLVWNIGQKFPVKSLEVSLSVTVTFTEFPSEEEEERNKTVDAKFCIEQNSYCELNFKISDFTLSGCQIDPRSITLFPSIKYKLTLGRELVSSGYHIWNSHGDALGIPFIRNEPVEEIIN
uniref:Uncharacterized protein n=1 Tax=Amphimedon queenslandica TaxID=400682 RepID=A0A1X7SRJ7_AMPQE